MYKFVKNLLEPTACFIYLVACFLQYKSRKEKAVKTLVWYYVIATLVLLASALAVKFKLFQTVFLYDIMGVITSLFVGGYFYHLLPNAAKKRAALCLIGLYLVYAVIRNITLDGQRLFDSLGYAILSASIAVYVFMYFHQLLKNVSEANVLKEFNFWLAAGYLFYYVGSSFIFISYYYFTVKILDTYTKQERALLSALWGLHNVLLFISALSLLIGCLWINFRRKSASS